jgi:hypothetical protein
MSRDDLVFVASRAFALLLATWALIDISYLPEELFALSHHVSLRSALAVHDYWTSYYWMVTVSNLVRIVALFFAAVLFWRCGPRVAELFSRPAAEQESSQ